MTLELRPEVFTADYTGRPGERTFFLQARSSSGVHSFLLEKQQVQVLGTQMRQLLLLIDARDSVAGATPERDPVMRLEAPIEPEWRVGTMGLAYDDDADLVILSLEPAAPEEDDADEDAEDDDIDLDAFEVRIFLRRDQARTFALHALAVVAEGRPTCQLCGLPMDDPENHVCPASNGHRLGAGDAND